METGTGLCLHLHVHPWNPGFTSQQTRPTLLRIFVRHTIPLPGLSYQQTPQGACSARSGVHMPCLLNLLCESFPGWQARIHIGDEHENGKHSGSEPENLGAHTCAGAEEPTIYLKISSKREIKLFWLMISEIFDPLAKLWIQREAECHQIRTVW